MSHPSLDPRTCWRAVASRDARFDGRFFTGVRTTGIYCRPACPSRTPRRENVAFYESAHAAQAAGFRPCLRCRPEAAPGSPAWTGDATIARALRLIDAGALDRDGVDALADTLGVGARHLRRLLVGAVGATPQQLAATRRLHFARRLLSETSLPVERVAIAAGFGSARRFRSAFRASFGEAPRRHRAARASRPASAAALELRLAWRPPLDAASLVGFLAARAVPGVERVSGLTFETTVRMGRAVGVIALALDAKAARVVVRAPADFAPHLLDVTARARRLLDLDADPLAIARQLGADATLRPLVRARPGLRVPGAWDPFASAVRTIAGQQVSVAAATTITGRIARDFGERLRGGAGGLDAIFPTPERLADAPLQRTGLLAPRAAAVRALARAVCEGAIVLQPGAIASPQETLCALPGVGEWTASCIAMRSLHDPDAFPPDDLGIRRALGGTRGDRLRRAEAWRPFRAYAAMHLWSAPPAARVKGRT